MTNVNFSALVKETTRPSDDYVNASKWCAAFGKRFDNYERDAQTKERWKAVAERIHSNVRELKSSVRGACCR